MEEDQQAKYPPNRPLLRGKSTEHFTDPETGEKYLVDPHFRYLNKGMPPTSTDEILLHLTEEEIRLIGDIKIGIPDKCVTMEELDRVVVPTGVESWVNVYHVFRGVRKNGSHTSPKISIRKYQFIHGYWKRRSVYNVNRPQEAMVLMSLLSNWFSRE